MVLAYSVHTSQILMMIALCFGLRIQDRSQWLFVVKNLGNPSNTSKVFLLHDVSSQHDKVPEHPDWVFRESSGLVEPVTRVSRDLHPGETDPLNSW